MGRKFGKTLLLHSFLKMECILLFFGEKKHSPKKATEICFFGECVVIFVSTDWLQFLEIMWLPVQLKSA
jgi:hypothetical protein